MSENWREALFELDIDPDRRLQIIHMIQKAMAAEADVSEERLKFLQEMGQRGQELMANNPGEPEDWPDAAKLRLQALYLDKYDLDRGVYDRTTVQEDLRRIADRIEELGDEW